MLNQKTIHVSRHRHSLPLTPPNRLWLGFAIQLLEAVEDGGYEANLYAVDADGEAEIEDPEVKASKVRERE